MPTPLSALMPGNAAAPELKPTGKDKTLGRQDFLQLLVSQLKNQDPLNPMEGADFTAQLAQFSSVEQLVEMNRGMLGIVEAVNSQSLLSQTALASGLLGRNAIAAGTIAKVDATGAARAHVDLPQAAKRVTVTLMNAAGQVVETREFGATGSGKQTLTWNTEAGLPEGSYRYSVTAEGSDGQSIAVRQFIEGVVEGLQFKDGKIHLNIGGTLVPMDQLSEISTPHPAAG